MRQGLLLAAVLLAGCASTYRQDVITAPSARLERNKAVVIATPAPGRFEQAVYPASGLMTASETRSAFAPYTGNIRISEQCKDIACLRAQAPGSDYYVVPEIMLWEDRATAWSGRPDRIQIRYMIFDASGAEPLSNTIISGSSRPATLAADKPEHLLPEPLKAYVDGLF